MAITYQDNQVEIRGQPPSETWWRGRQWAVTKLGIERRNGLYAIRKKQLLHLEDCGWVKHVGLKGWADVDDFATAYFIAVALHRLRLTPERRALEMAGQAYVIEEREKWKIHDELFPPKSDFELCSPLDFPRFNRERDEPSRRNISAGERSRMGHGERRAGEQEHDDKRTDNNSPARAEFEQAMHQLLLDGTIRTVLHGQRPSKKRRLFRRLAGQRRDDADGSKFEKKDMNGLKMEPVDCRIQPECGRSKKS